VRFRSVNGRSKPVNFSSALFSGLALDGGLFVPESLPKLPETVLANLKKQTLPFLGAQIASLFIDEIPAKDLEVLVARAWNFPIPLTELEPGIYLLELFHGPTLAFKDVGARFMAQVMSFFLEQEHRELTIVVATSGDTGSAVAHGFHNVPHIRVFVLYPSGKVSPLQEKQMTTLGGNIHPLEVAGTFDDCQRLVKQALADRELAAKLNLTTANSINIGRLVPQIVYYAWAAVQWQRVAVEKTALPLVVVPSGNFGNITAAAYAMEMGVPFAGLLAATNANDTVPLYLKTGRYKPQPSRGTISNAMDVGDPSNLARLRDLFGNDVAAFKRKITAFSVSDEDTLREIRRCYEANGVVVDPHTAVGITAARRYLNKVGVLPVIVAATAHPGKFPEVVEKAIGMKIPLPPALREAMTKPKQAVAIAVDYGELKRLLWG
jgi:threonine synthase